MTSHLVIDDLPLLVRRSVRRKTVGITVERDGALVAAAPINAPDAVIEGLVRARQLWIHRKLAALRQHPPPAPREYVAGETCYYLGRGHRLQLVDPGGPALLLRGGRFLLRRDERPRAAEHFAAWYVTQGVPWLTERVARLAARVGVSPAGVAMRDLGHRWGSCGVSGRLLFHWRVILLPPPAIDYVAAHELVHLRERRHSAEYWRRLERAMPDHVRRREWLLEHGARYR
jgi:hypothetical protein